MIDAAMEDEAIEIIARGERSAEDTARLWQGIRDDLRKRGPFTSLILQFRQEATEALAGLATPVRALSFEYLPASREIALACIERLAELAPYRYNWSVGETHRLAAEHWLDAAGMRRHLNELPPSAPSGDVYAVRQDG